MAHRFDRSKRDPYVAADQQVERNVFRSAGGYAAGAGEELYDALGDAIVTALGDVAAQAFRLGVNSPDQVKGLARAIAAVSETVLLSYQGEVDPTPALDAIRGDPRLESLPPESRDKLIREIEKTLQLEQLILNARRLPALLDYAGSLGLHVPDETAEQGPVLVSADTHQPPPGQQ